MALLKTQNWEVKNKIANYMKAEGIPQQALKEIVSIYCQEPYDEEQNSYQDLGKNSADSKNQTGSENNRKSSSKKLKIELMSLERLEKEENVITTKRILTYLEILVLSSRDDDQMLKQLLETIHAENLTKIMEEIMTNLDISTPYNSY